MLTPVSLKNALPYRKRRADRHIEYLDAYALRDYSDEFFLSMNIASKLKEKL